MNKWIAINGSPRKGKNTDTFLENFRSLISCTGDSVNEYKLSELHLNPCKGCYLCQKEKTCLHNDDFQKIIMAIKASKNIILVSPTYNYNVTSEMKIFLDRLFCEFTFKDSKYYSNLDIGINAIIVGICAGKTNESMGFTIDAMKRPLLDHGIKIVDEIEYFDTKNNPVFKNANLSQIMESIKLK